VVIYAPKEKPVVNEGRPKTDRDLQTFVVELRKADLEKLRGIAKREDSSVGRLVRKAIASWLTTDEMMQQALKADGEKVSPGSLEAIIKMLGEMQETLKNK
jgi:hypothetical protein